MQFDSLHDFLAMGGYALYVWLSFGVSLLALVWVVLPACFNDSYHPAKYACLFGVVLSWA